VTTCRRDFVSGNRTGFGVRRMCRVLQMSRSGFRRWLSGADARVERRAAGNGLVAQIRAGHPCGGRRRSRTGWGTPSTASGPSG